jgi:hypothetical protein
VTGPPFLAEYEARLAGPWTDIQDQLPMLYERACRYPRVRILEFGVRTGESTSAFLAAAERMRGRVRSYDIDAPQTPAWWQGLDSWCFTRGSSLDAQPGAGECDVLFIDTSHGYDATLRELARWVPHVVPGGLVLCHDTKLADPPFEPYAVARALGAYCGSTGLEWRELGGHYGLGEIEIGRLPMSEHEEIRGAYAGRPGVGAQVEQALAERANDEAYGADTSRPDKILGQLGETARQARERSAAAAARRAAAKENDGEARHEPPEGRQTRPEATTAAPGPATAGGDSGAAGVTAKGGKQQAAGGSPPRGDSKGK